MASAIPLVRQTIVDALEGDEDALKGIQVSRHREPTNASEWVWVYKARAKERDFKVLGPRPVPVEEEVEVFMRVVAIRTDPGDAESRAEVLANAVEGLLREITVAAPVLMPLLVKQRDEEPLDFDKKAGHHILMTVATKARI